MVRRKLKPTTRHSTNTYFIAAPYHWYSGRGVPPSETSPTLASFSNGDLGMLVRKPSDPGAQVVTDLWRFDSMGNITLFAADVLKGAFLVDTILIADRDDRWTLVGLLQQGNAVGVRRWSADLSSTEGAYLLQGAPMLEFYSLSQDEVGNIFVLGRLGSAREGQAMLCKIPLDASPACYRVPAMSGRSIVARCALAAVAWFAAAASSRQRARKSRTR